MRFGRECTTRWILSKNWRSNLTMWHGHDTRIYMKLVSFYRNQLTIKNTSTRISPSLEIESRHLEGFEIELRIMKRTHSPALLVNQQAGTKKWISNFWMHSGYQVPVKPMGNFGCGFGNILRYSNAIRERAFLWNLISVRMLIWFSLGMGLFTVKWDL